MTSTPPFLDDLEGLEEDSSLLLYSPSIQNSSKRTSVLSRESLTLTINEIDHHKSPSGTLSPVLILNEDQTTSTPRVLSHHLDSDQSNIGIDIPQVPQTSQSHLATSHCSQPGPAQLNQIQNSTLLNSGSVEVPSPSRHQSASRPHSLAELADIVKQSVGDDPRPLKVCQWLRIAENVRRDAKTFKEQGNLELAFVEYAKAATIVLEKIPFHPDYRVVLSMIQRHNMGLVSYIRLVVPISAVWFAIHEQFVIYVPYKWINE